MILIGKFNEEQLKAKEDKAACEKIKKESGGNICYFFPKFRKRKGKTIVEVYGMSSEEYCNSDIL